MAFLCPVFIQAQMNLADTTDPGSLTDEQVFELLDDTEIPTRLLWDKAEKFDNPIVFDGISLTSENQQSFSRFGYTYATLYGMPLDTNSLIASPDGYMNAAEGYSTGDSLPLSVVRYQF